MSLAVSIQGVSMHFEVLGRKPKEWCCRWCFHFFLRLKFVTLEVKGGGRKCTEGTSGHGDGVRVENCVCWTAAQIHPRTAGSWQEAGCTNQNLRRTCCRRPARVTRKSLTRNFGGRNKNFLKSPNKSIKPEKTSTAPEYQRGFLKGKETAPADSSRRGMDWTLSRGSQSQQESWFLS